MLEWPFWFVYLLSCISSISASPNDDSELWASNTSDTAGFSFPDPSFRNLQTVNSSTGESETQLGRGHIKCWSVDPRLDKVTVDICRPTLRKFTTFPNRRGLQDFLMHEKPKRPCPPPFSFHHSGTDCVVELYSYGDNTDRFSWEQVRVLAQEILQYCQDDGLSLGGKSMIGNGLGWEVAVHSLTPGRASSMIAQLTSTTFVPQMASSVVVS